MTKKKIRLSLSIAGGIVVIVALLGYWLFFSAFSSNEKTAYVYIDSDDNIDSVYVKVEKAGKPSQMAGFKMTAQILGYDENIRTGKYEINRQLTSIQLVRNLRNKFQVPVQLTIPNVRTLERLSSELAKRIAPDSTTLIEYFRNQDVCKKFEYDTATLACIFIPNTYEVYWDITPEQLLTRMQKENKRFWTTERKQKAEKQGLSLNEAYTLASIVDQETANNGEKPKIAGMYLNRLRKNMLLQADPTVKFALQQFGLRRILHEHLTVDNPYNTYKYKGLPPGPISIPSVASIDAVLNADDNSYLFMCAKEDFSGTHNFASTYGEHLKNARKYSQALDKRGIK